MTDKPPMPKRPVGRPKATKPPPQDDELDSELLRLDERACVLLCVEYDEQKAALEMGWPLADVQKLLREPRARLFLQKADESFFKEYGKARVRRLLKVGVTKANIEERLMELALMDPSHTKNSIEGQVKALGVLADKFGYGHADDPVSKMTQEEQKELIRKAGQRLIEGVVDQAVN
jgi:hypothetical protein